MTSFIVLTYNQEDFILEHLESLKYQIKMFASDRDIQLIVGDDGSTDRTLYYTKAWVDLNRNLFKEINFVGDGQNHGTCSNLVACFRAIHGCCYKLLAGDDLYSFNNIFEYLNFLNDADVIDTLPVEFNQQFNDIQTQFRIYRNHLLFGLYPKWLQKILCRYECITLGPTVTYRKKYITPVMLEFVEQFHLIEDQPMAYFIFTAADTFIYRFIPKSYIIYRNNSQSVSHSHLDSPIGSLRNQDLIRISQIFFDREKNKLYKWIASQRLKKYTGQKEILSIIVRNFKRMITIMLTPFIYFRYLKIVKKDLNRNQLHVRAIQLSAKIVRDKIDEP